MIHYILQTLAFQLLFLVIYDLFLKKETFFNLNRLYLLITPVLSFILPFVKIEAIQQNIPQQYMLQLPTVLIGGTSEKNISSSSIGQISIQSGNLISWENVLQSIWIAGMIVSLLYFSYKLYKIYNLKRSGSQTKIAGLSLILLPKTDTAFSFFNVVFLGEDLSEENKKNILAHEEVHIKQKHSVDLLFFELLRIVFWFNPLVYIFQNRITTLQEYIADAKSTFQDDKKQYYQHLLSQVFQTDKISFINTFFNHSLIKKRIVMLQKSKSKKIFKLKYLLILPVIGLMLFYNSCSQSERVFDENSYSEKIQNSELAQYSFRVKSYLGTVINTPETKLIHEKYRNFLKNNPDYVAWIVKKDGFENYSVHSSSEVVPKELYNEFNIQFTDGKPYKGYTNFDNPGSNKSKLNESNMKNENDKRVIEVPMSESEENRLLNQKYDLPEISYVNGYKPTANYSNIAGVPFAQTDKIPIFPGCEELSNSEAKKCVSEKIQEYVAANFDINIANGLGLSGRQKIDVQFSITKKGIVSSVYVISANSKLKQEAIRVISNLPKMIPGESNGEKVNVLYYLPIVFEIK